jgi:prophage tail gpP-like protein
MAEADRVELKVAGRLFSSWKDVSVSRGIANPSGAFSLTYAERTNAGAPPEGIRPGMACEVLIGGETVINGFVDAPAPGFDSESRTLSVTGRDRTADLVDCSAMNSPGVWRGRTMAQIATDLIAPFGLAVEVRADAGAPFKAFAIQQGETVWEAIERLARFRGLLAVATPAGGVAFIRPGQRRAAFSLRQGVNLKAGQAEHDHSQRFSRYVVKGQSAGDDDVNGAAAAGPSAEATDPAVKRHRPLMVIAEEQATLASLTARAGWEANLRAAEGERVALTVQGWRDPAGAIWSADLVVPVFSPWLDIDGDQLIADVTFQLDGQGGSTTVLSCAPADAYRPAPPSAEDSA